LAACSAPRPASEYAQTAREIQERVSHARSRWISVLITTMGLLASGAAPTDEASLTEIWEGIQVCDDPHAGVQLEIVADDRVEITQRDGHLRLQRVTQDGSASLLYEGTVVTLASSERFEAMVSICGGSYEAQEIVRLRRVRVNENGSGSFDAESL
jgi:hypothetical protein